MKLIDSLLWIFPFIELRQHCLSKVKYLAQSNTANTELKFSCSDSYALSPGHGGLLRRLQTGRKKTSKRCPIYIAYFSHMLSLDIESPYRSFRILFSLLSSRSSPWPPTPHIFFLVIVDKFQGNAWSLKHCSHSSSCNCARVHLGLQNSNSGAPSNIFVSSVVSQFTQEVSLELSHPMEWACHLAPLELPVEKVVLGNTTGLRAGSLSHPSREVQSKTHRQHSASPMAHSPTDFHPSWMEPGWQLRTQAPGQTLCLKARQTPQSGHVTLNLSPQL